MQGVAMQGVAGRKLTCINFFCAVRSRRDGLYFSSQEETMRRFFTGLAATAVLAAGLTAISSRSEAATIAAPGGVKYASESLGLTETVQFWGGRQYCWYDDG